MYQLIEEHYRHKRRSLRNRGGSNDVIQETYARACKYWSSYDFNSSFDNWISGIFTNAVKGLYELNKKQGMVDNDIVPGFIPRGKPLKYIQLMEILQKIEDEAHSYILRLSLIDGFTSNEVAQIVPENENNIRQIVYRFRQGLRKGLRG